MSTASLPSTATSGTVAGRLNRSRDTGSSTGEVKWPELMEKFKQTQERARRRNERFLRGMDDTNLGGGPGTRNLLDGADPGRSSRNSNRENGEKGSNLVGPRAGSGLGRPLNAGSAAAQAGLVKAGSGLTISGAASGRSSLEERTAPHKRGHSLAGGLGKFASGIARAGSSRDREKAKKP